jgi:hypothetical protein
MRDAHYIYWAEAVLHKLVCLFSIEVQWSQQAKGTS